MKTPHKFYRSLRRRSSRLASAFRDTYRPLASAFRTQAEIDVARGLNMELCKRGVMMVVASLMSAGRNYRGTKLSYVFAALSARRKIETTEFHGPTLN